MWEAMGNIQDSKHMQKPPVLLPNSCQSQAIHNKTPLMTKVSHLFLFVIFIEDSQQAE